MVEVKVKVKVEVEVEVKVKVEVKGKGKEYQNKFNRYQKSASSVHLRIFFSIDW